MVLFFPLRGEMKEVMELGSVVEVLVFDEVPVGLIKERGEEEDGGEVGDVLIDEVGDESAVGEVAAREGEEEGLRE